MDARRLADRLGKWEGAIRYCRAKWHSRPQAACRSSGNL